MNDNTHSSSEPGTHGGVHEDVIKNTGKNTSADWQQAERGSAWGMRMTAWLALRLGRRLTKMLVAVIVLFFWLTSPQQRRVSATYLRQVAKVSGAVAQDAGAQDESTQDDGSKRLGIWDTYRHMYCFAVTVLDRVYLLAGKASVLHVDVHDDVQAESIMADRGGLFITSHLGSFEVMRALGKQRRSFQIKFLMDYQHGARVGAALAAINPEFLEHVIDVGESDVDLMLRIRDEVKKGNFVGIMADRMTARDTPVVCDFLGQRVELPLSPWLLASMLDVPVIVCFGLYRGGNRYTLHFDALNVATHTVGAKARRNRRQQAEALAQAYAKRLEYYAKLAPYNWFNFYPFWLPGDETFKSSKSNPLSNGDSENSSNE